MINKRRVTLLVAEKLREIATRQGVVPFDKGDLRKSHVSQTVGADSAAVGSNLPYARAVHDGRPEILIRPRRARALFFPGLDHPVKQVRQPAREGKPWLRQSVDRLKLEGLGFLSPEIGDSAVRALEAAMRRNPNLKIGRKKS
jgi:hypothetical protein